MQARPTLAAVATTLLIGAAAVPARAQDAMFSFTDGRAPAQMVLPRSPAGATATTTVTIANHRATVTRADVELDPLAPPAEPGAVYAGDPVRLERGERRHKLALTFSSGASATPPGTYRTDLVLRGRNAARNTVLEKPVFVKVLLPGDAPDVPVSVERATPISDDFDAEVRIAGLLPASSGAGTLTDEEGDTVQVSAETTPDAETGTSRVRLSGDGLESGSFSGRVALGDLGGIDVTLRVEDSFWWLLLALVLGVALAVGAERYVRGGRAEARRLIEQARTAVSVAEGAGRQLTSQLQLFLQRAERGELPAGGPALAVQRRLLAAIERDLLRLREALARAADGEQDLPPFTSKEVAALIDPEETGAGTPRFLRAADVPAGDAAPEELERQHRAIEQAVLLAEAWPGLRRDFWDLSGLIDRARTGKVDRGAIELIAGRFDVLLLRLRQADSAAEVDPDEFAAALARLQEQLTLAAAGVPPTPAGDHLLPVPANSTELAHAQPRGASIALSPLAAQERRRRTVLSIITGIAVVFAGLLVLYFDDPFVSAQDYVSGLVWGVLGKVLLDGVVTVFDRVAAVRPGEPEAG